MSSNANLKAKEINYNVSPIVYKPNLEPYPKKLADENGIGFAAKF